MSRSGSRSSPKSKSMALSSFICCCKRRLLIPHGFTTDSLHAACWTWWGEATCGTGMFMASYAVIFRVITITLSLIPRLCSSCLMLWFWQWYQLYGSVVIAEESLEKLTRLRFDRFAWHTLNGHKLVWIICGVWDQLCEMLTLNPTGVKLSNRGSVGCFDLRVQVVSELRRIILFSKGKGSARYKKLVHLVLFV